MAFAVLGDSYVSRLERYVQQQPEIKNKPAIKFFGVPGMSTQRKLEPTLTRVLEYRPRLDSVFLSENVVNLYIITFLLVRRLHTNMLMHGIMAIVQQYKCNLE